VRWTAGIILIVGLWVAGVESSYARPGMQFSGQARQSAPNGQTRIAKLFVGDNRIRMEYQRNERNFIEIYDLADQRIQLLVPQQKIYMQRSLPPGQLVNPLLPPVDSNPCTAIPEGRCKKLGSEIIHGRPVSRWEVTVDHQGEVFRSLHWIDDERLMSLRDVWPNGAVSELMLTDFEELDGRTTERWQRTTVSPEKGRYVTTLWYDPELEMVVREERPGGFVREIRNIHIEKQPAELFKVPPDYRRIEYGVDKLNN